MKTSNPNCTLHALPFHLFCEKCYEPICSQCTLLGPHNTQLHAITPIAPAYQRRVQEIRARLAKFVEQKHGLVEEIRAHASEVEELKETQQLGLAENERHRARITTDLQRTYERISSEISLVKEELQARANELNDLGHSFESLVDAVEIVGSQGSIMQELKECADRIALLLQQEQLFGKLPKELTSLRGDLKSIETYRQLAEQKAQVLQEILKRLDGERAKIERPTIAYPSLLHELSENMDRCLEHNVCHFCGTVFSIEAANTPCKANNSTLDIAQFQGYCSAKPESLRWATHRHFFSAPKDPLRYFAAGQADSFGTNLQSLLLKLRTICVIREIDLKKSLLKADRKASGSCDRISMLYVLIEVCGLSQQESQILLSTCQQLPAGYDYTALLETLQQIPI